MQVINYVSFWQYYWHFARLLIQVTYSYSNSSRSLEYLLFIAVSLSDSTKLISGSLSVYGWLKLYSPSNFSCVLIIWLHFRCNYGVLAFAPSLGTCLHQSDECGTVSPPLYLCWWEKPSFYNTLGSPDLVLYVELLLLLWMKRSEGYGIIGIYYSVNMKEYHL